MTAPPPRALGIDIGGTKIAAAVVDGAGTIAGRHRVPTPVAVNGDEVFAAVCAAADGALREAGYRIGSGYDDPAGLAGERDLLAGVGAATAGPLDEADGTVAPVNIPAWRGYPLRERLSRRYGGPIRLFGDGIAIAIAEHWLGAGRGADNVLGMVVSTGVGGGLVLGGRVLFGSGGNAGHIGHMSIEACGPRCACGGVGCLEALASGTAIAAWYADQRGESVVWTAAELADRARDGDDLARAAFTRSATALGQALAGVVTLLDLDRVVIGGGVAHAWDLLADPMEAAYRRFAALDFAGLDAEGAGADGTRIAGTATAGQSRIVRAALGADTGVLGAAAVVLHPDRYWH